MGPEGQAAWDLWQVLVDLSQPAWKAKENRSEAKKQGVDNTAQYVFPRSELDASATHPRVVDA